MATEPLTQLVVIGASAGGIESLPALLAALPSDFPVPIVIAQHIDPHRPSHLQEILARRSGVRVETIEQAQELSPGVAYVVPSNRHVEITDHMMMLREDHIAGPKPSVDLLFASAAQAYGEGLIAVILSGMGSDGAAGARHVKQHGGTVIIEDPDTASFPSMPQSLAPTTVDIAVNVDRIGPLLVDLLGGGSAAARTDTDESMKGLLEELRERGGIDFSSYKQPTIQRRLRRRIVATGNKTLEDYIAYLADHSDEYQRLVNSFLIKVTDFFRDAELYNHLRSSVLPDIIENARRYNRDVRIWSAGCATGEEAYSLGILVSECLGAEAEDLNVRIFATDVDDEAVNFARRGLYQASALAGVDPDLVAKYFTEEEAGQYEIRKRVRAMMVFGQHDLGQRAPFPHIDLILCRNVLIYFTTELQRRALQLFAFALRDAGYLVMGKAETTSPLADFFAIEDPTLKIYRRHGDRLLIPPGRLAGGGPTPARAMARHQPSGRALSRRLEQRPNVRTASERLFEDLFRQLAMGLVIVNPNYDVQHINPAARQLLGIHATALGDDFIHLAQSIPSRPLKGAIDRTLREGSVNRLSEVETEDVSSGQKRYLEVTCYPQDAVEENGGRHLLIVVVDVTDRVLQRLALEEAAATAAAERENVSGQLDRVLETNHDLLEANAELTMVNMDLRGANEEFLVNNEEVQAATEEVETLNEELQATNEELETLNEELQATVEELNTTNDDVQARSAELQELAAEREEQRRQLEDEKSRLEVILASIGSALLVVDMHGQPVMTNDAYDRMFGADGAALRPEALDGRALTPAETPQRRAAAGESFRMDFSVLHDGGQRRWYEALGNPLRRRDGNGQRAMSGVVAIRDVTDRSLLQLQEEYLAMISHELRTPLTALSGFLQLVSRSLAAEPQSEVRRRQMELATQQARRLGTLIDELLDVTRLQTGKMTLHLENADLVRIVNNAVDIARALGDGRDIELQLPAEPLPARVDPGRVEQVLLNLLNNALTHTRSQDRIAVRLRQARGMAEFDVTDTGPGIPPAEVPNLFERYYQVRHEGRAGLGLGLYIVKQIVEAHDGDVQAQSTVGQGTAFTVRLPLASD